MSGSSVTLDTTTSVEGGGLAAGDTARLGLQGVVTRITDTVSGSPFIWWLLSLLIVLPAVLEGRALDPDLFARLAVGELTVQSGYVHMTDPFAWTSKLPRWIDHEWLAGVCFHQAETLWSTLGKWWSVPFSDGTGINVLRVFLWSLSSWFLVRAMRVAGARGVTALVALLVVGLSTVYLWRSPLRSQAITYLLLPYLLYCAVSYEQEGRWRGLTLWPPLMVIWCNFHGGFVVGLGLLALFIVRQVLDSRQSLKSKGWIVALGLVTVAATALNPYGFVTYWQYILHAVGMERKPIPEWAPLSLYTPEAILLILGAFSSALLTARGKLKVSSLTLMLPVSLYFGFSSTRLVAIPLMVLLVLLLPGIHEKGGRLRSARVSPLRNSTVAVILGLALVSGLGAARSYFVHGYALTEDGYPQSEVEWLKAKGQGGNLLVDFNNGSYALKKLYPAYLVSMDGRYEEVYPEATVDQVANWYQRDSDIDAQPVDYILADKRMMRSMRTWSEAAATGWFGESFCVVSSSELFVLYSRSPADCRAGSVVERSFPATEAGLS